MYNKHVFEVLFVAAARTCTIARTLTSIEQRNLLCNTTYATQIFEFLILHRFDNHCQSYVHITGDLFLPQHCESQCIKT